MFGEKKSDIFDLIPEKYLPKTYLIEKGDLHRASLEAERLGFPVIVKPDIGERGTWVAKINGQDELKAYVASCPVNFLLQELIDYPIELGVFYVRYPGQEGRVTSIVRKEFLQVAGDGSSTVLDLLKDNDRAFMTADLESPEVQQVAGKILQAGETQLIEPIGNHCRGTKFLDDGANIDQELTAAFNRLASEIPAFYFGRFDLKCRSYDDLKKLAHFKILELNGAGAEPAHIYQPGFSLIKAYRVILWHLSVLSDISALNRKKGHPYCGFKEGIKKLNAHRRYNRVLTSA